MNLSSIGKVSATTGASQVTAVTASLARVQERISVWHAQTIGMGAAIAADHALRASARAPSIDRQGLTIGNAQRGWFAIIEEPVRS